MVFSIVTMYDATCRKHPKKSGSQNHLKKERSIDYVYYIPLWKGNHIEKSLKGFKIWWRWGSIYTKTKITI